VHSFLCTCACIWTGSSEAISSTLERGGSIFFDFMYLWCLSLKTQIPTIHQGRYMF
jgi:hypothetical protein